MSPQLTKEEVKTLQQLLQKEITIVMKNKVSSTNMERVANMIKLILKLAQ